MGMVCPQCIFRLRRFVGVVQDPPSFNPGSWRGTGDNGTSLILSEWGDHSQGLPLHQPISINKFLI